MTAQPGTTALTLNAPRDIIERAVTAANEGDGQAAHYLADLIERALAATPDAPPF